MSWLSRFMLANWSHVLGALILLISLLFGMQIGASRIQKEWDAEKQKIALTQARQEQRVADVRQTQAQVTQEISNEYAKRSKLLADRQPDSRTGGVCNIPSAGGRDLSAVPEAPAGAHPSRPWCMPPHVTEPTQMPALLPPSWLSWPRPWCRSCGPRLRRGPVPDACSCRVAGRRPPLEPPHPHGG